MQIISNIKTCFLKRDLLAVCRQVKFQKYCSKETRWQALLYILYYALDVEVKLLFDMEAM